MMTSRWQRIREWYRWQFEPPLNFISIFLWITMLLAIILGVFDPDQQDMYQNLAAEVFGVWLAIVIIGTILRDHQRKKELPARKAALCEAFRIHWRCMELVSQMIFSAMDPERDSDILASPDVRVFSPEVMHIITELDLDSEAPFFGVPSWRWFIHSRVQAIRDDVRHVLQAYAVYLSPQVLEQLRELDDAPLLGHIAPMLPDYPEIFEEMRRFMEERVPERPQRLSAVPFDTRLPINWETGFDTALIGLGKAIADELPKYAGMSRVPENFDPEAKWVFDEARNRLIQHGLMPPAEFSDD